MRRNVHHARGGRRPHGEPRHVVRRIEGGREPPGHGDALGAVVSREQERELVPADAPDQVLGAAVVPDGRREASRDEGEEHVARAVAERVVHGLEPVEVQQHDGGGVSSASSARIAS